MYLLKQFSVFTAIVSLTFFMATPLSADVILENWQFDDTNGTTLNNAANTGATGSSFNFGGPRTQNGNLNIGDPASGFVWPTGGGFVTGQTFRNADFAGLTSGQYVFEYVIADWDFGGADGVGDPNNGIKFNFGDSSQSSMASLEFEVAQAPGTDIRVRSQGSNNGNLSGTDAQNQLGAFNLTNAAQVTVQLIADLDTGVWTTQVDAGNGFVDLVTDGMGMTSIDRIQLVIDGRNGSGWAADEFIKIDSVTLTRIEAVPEPTCLTLAGLTFVGMMTRRRKSSK